MPRGIGEPRPEVDATLHDLHLPLNLAGRYFTLLGGTDVSGSPLRRGRTSDLWRRRRSHGLLIKAAARNTDAAAHAPTGARKMGFN